MYYKYIYILYIQTLPSFVKDYILDLYNIFIYIRMYRLNISRTLSFYTSCTELKRRFLIEVYFVTDEESGYIRSGILY